MPKAIHVERSPLLAGAGVPHAFTGTLPASRRPELLATLELSDRTLITTRQVHGRGVLLADRQAPHHDTEADALVCTRPDRAVAVYTADCVPVLLSTPDGSAVAAVHAGWRGLAAGVIAAAVARLPDKDLLAAVGPCISAPPLRRRPGRRRPARPRRDAPRPPPARRRPAPRPGRDPDRRQRHLHPRQPEAPQLPPRRVGAAGNVVDRRPGSTVETALPGGRKLIVV